MNVVNFIRIAGATALLASWVALSGCAAATAQGGRAVSTTASGESDAEAAALIRAAIRGYESALNANEIEKILGLYGSEPAFMPQHAPALVGRDAVRAGYQRVFETIKLDIRFEIHEVEVAGDWAWARTSSAGRTRILAAGTEIDEGNNELFVFRRERGAWKIHRYLFATNRPRG